MDDSNITLLYQPSLLFPSPHVLSDRGIGRNIRNGRISIDDYTDKQVQPASLDVRVGKVSVFDARASALLACEFNSLSFKERLTYEPGDEHALKYGDELDIPIDIPPRSLAEITIHERIRTMFHKRVDLRSSRGRLGFHVESFDGNVLGVRNYNPNTVRVYGRSSFAQMFFHTKSPNDGVVVSSPRDAKIIGDSLGIQTLGPYLLFQLGEHAYRYKPVGLIDTKNPRDDLYDKVRIDNLFIPTGETIIAQLQPKITLPPHLAVQLIDMPYVQTGFSLSLNPEMFFCESHRSNAGLIDPGYTGNVTAHLMRTKTPKVYHQGDDIILGVITKFHEPVLRPYGSSQLGSHYQGSTGAVSKS